MPAKTKIQIAQQVNVNVLEFGKEALEWATPRYFKISYLVGRFGVKSRNYDNGVPRWIRELLKENGIYLRKKNNTSFIEVYTDRTTKMRKTE